MIDYKMLNGGDLAFIGDAYLELRIREYVLSKGITSLHLLHDECVKYVSRDSQDKIINLIQNELSEEEYEIFKRGRNYNYKNKSPEYINASGYEALIAYLYLSKNSERLDYIINKSIEIIEKQ